MKKTIILFIIILAFNQFAYSDSEVSSNFYVPVLMYHHIDENVPPNNSSNIITPENFKKQMVYLKAIGFNTITFSELVNAKFEGASLPPNPIIITFDDGYLSNYTYAYPILKELNMKANINIVVSTVGKTPGLYPHFDWHQAREMVESGVIEIGSHTYDMHNNKLFESSYTDSNVYYDRLFNDFIASKKIITENLGINTNILCFPYGYYNSTVLKAGKDAGFNIFLTVDKGINTVNDSSLIIKRINVDNNDTPQYLLKKIYSYYPSNNTIPLIDVNSDTIYFEDILYLYENNLIKGSEDGRLKLYNYTTEGDFYNIINRILNYKKYDVETIKSINKIIGNFNNSNTYITLDKVDAVLTLISKDNKYNNFKVSNLPAFIPRGELFRIITGILRND